VDACRRYSEDDHSLILNGNCTRMLWIPMLLIPHHVAHTFVFQMTFATSASAAPPLQG